MTPRLVLLVRIQSVTRQPSSFQRNKLKQNDAHMTAASAAPPPDADRGFFVPVPLTATSGPPEDVYKPTTLLVTASVALNHGWLGWEGHR